MIKNRDAPTVSNTYHEERVVVSLARAELAARLPTFIQGTMQLALNGALRHLCVHTAGVLIVKQRLTIFNRYASAC